MSIVLTPDEMEARIGENLRRQRLMRNISQSELAERAGVSPNSLKRLEQGQGSSLRTLVCVAKALGRTGWIETMAPIASINPLTMPRSAQPRQRASRRQKPEP